MKYSEAIAWLDGKRSTQNIVPQDPFETWQVRVAQADAAMMEQAYWVAKAHQDRAEAINILFDGPPGRQSGRFVEVENDDGESINAGEWIQCENGLWALRITALPIAT
jgi:hypothetical protein